MKMIAYLKAVTLVSAVMALLFILTGAWYRCDGNVCYPENPTIPIDSVLPSSPEVVVGESIEADPVVVTPSYGSVGTTVRSWSPTYMSYRSSAYGSNGSYGAPIRSYSYYSSTPSYSRSMWSGGSAGERGFRRGPLRRFFQR